MKKQLSESQIREEVRRIAEVRATHPEPPPGVKAFDARRLRRHRVKGTLLRHIRQLETELGVEHKSHGVLASALEERGRELREARTWRAALRAIWRAVWPWARQ